MKKRFNELCGPACVNYILKLDKNPFVCNNDLFWCCDLALFLLEKGYKVTLKCFNSRLYNDYKKSEKDNLNFEGFLSIKKYLSKYSIIEEHVTTQTIKYEIHNYDYCIYNVNSNIYSNRPNSSGHYILSVKDNNSIYLINPLKNSYQKESVNIEKIYKSIKDFGAWRILISKK